MCGGEMDQDFPKFASTCSTLGKRSSSKSLSWFWSYCLAEQISVLTYCWEWWAACLENRMPGWKGSAFPKQTPSLELTWNVWREVRGSVEALASYRGTQIELWDDVTDAQPQYQCSLSHHPRFALICPLFDLMNDKVAENRSELISPDLERLMEEEIELLLWWRRSRV